MGEVTAARTPPQAGAMSPASWARTLSGPPVLDRVVPGVTPLVIRHWRAIDPHIDQGALDHHFLSLHLGGAKRLWRRGEGGARTCDAARGAFSVVPAGAAFRWETQGPVDFTHIYFDPAAADRLIEQAFGRDPAGVSIREALGSYDPLIHALGEALVGEIQGSRLHQPYVDHLAQLLVMKLLKINSDVEDVQDLRAASVAPFRVRRARDFVEQNLHRPIGVTEIAGAAGVSVFHFSRAFKLATGASPYAYLLQRRLLRAKRLLGESVQPLAAIAQACGFGTTAQFARAFRRHAGLTPAAYRRAL